MDLPRTAEDIDRCDVTLIVCMLSDVVGDDVNGFSETSTVGNDLRDLCTRLSRFRRHNLIIGAAADIWGFAIGWDAMVEKMVMMARSLGIPTIAGQRKFAEFEKEEDGWHSVKNDANQRKHLKMLEEVRNVAYAISPCAS